MLPIVALEGICKGFQDGDENHRVLWDINLAINAGETVALTGPSGSGKSTLLNLIAGFDYPDSGTLTLLGQNSRQLSEPGWDKLRRTSLGMVFQQFNLLAPLNVRANIQFPLAINGLGWTPWCDRLCLRLGLASLLEREVDSLSGGQQQRVAIARALALKPPLLLADEPTGNLDELASSEVMSLLCELALDAGSAVLMVTHSEHAAAYLQRRWHLSGGTIREQADR